MVRPVTSERSAQHAARTIKLFRERLNIVEAERACLIGMINELTDALLEYQKHGVVVTRTGKVLSDKEIEDLAAEAERGYEIDQLRERKLRGT